MRARSKWSRGENDVAASICHGKTHEINMQMLLYLSFSLGLGAYILYIHVQYNGGITTETGMMTSFPDDGHRNDDVIF